MGLSDIANYISSFDDTVKDALASVPGGESLAKAFGFGPPPEYDSNEEGEEISFVQKIGNALYSMCIGIVLVFVCLGVSGWNEYRNVAEMRTLSAGRESFSQATCAINSELDKKLVHASCDVKNVSHLGQQIDGLRYKSADDMRGLSLRSTVEVYAWIESVSEKKSTNSVGGGDTVVKTYTYKQEWTTGTPKAVSTFFKQGAECKKQNNNVACENFSPEEEFKGTLAVANKLELGSNKVIEESKNVQLGEYSLPADMVKSLGDAKDITPSCDAPSSRRVAPEQGQSTSSTRASSSSSFSPFSRVQAAARRRWKRMSGKKGDGGAPKEVKRRHKGVSITTAYPNATAFGSDIKRMMHREIEGYDAGEAGFISSRTHGGGSTATSQMTNDNTITPDEFVEEHNAYRCELGLEPLAWDCQLAAAAQLYADHQATNNGCAMVHSTNTERQGFLAQAGYSGHAGAGAQTGENLAWTSAITWSNGDRETQTKNGREVSGMWASEKEWYHMGASGDSCTIDTTVDGQNGMVGHYTAQIWHATTHVGCGVSQCNDHSVLWVCQYYPAGNYVGQLPFCKSNKPSDMGACSDLSSQSDPVGLTCNAGSGSCGSDGTVCSTASGVTTCGDGLPAAITGCSASSGTTPSPSPSDDSASSGTTPSPPPSDDSASSGTTPSPPPSDDSASSGSTPSPPSVEATPAPGNSTRPPTRDDRLFCDDPAAIKACEAEERSTTGVKSNDCFEFVGGYAASLAQCDPATFLKDNARFKELAATETESASEEVLQELMGLMKANMPAACKSALACFGSNTVGAKEIVMTVTLPYASKEAFTPDLQLEFREALARVAGVPVEQVIILSITVARRRGLEDAQAPMRHLLQGGSGSLSVQTQVTTPSDPSVMSLNNINTALASTSVPQITAIAPLVVSCPDGWGVDKNYLKKRRGGKEWLRRKFQLFTTSKASVLAQQSGSTFEKWVSPYDEDYSIYDVTAGAKTAEEMFDAAEASNEALTWILRVITLGGVVMSLQMVTAPIAIAPDIIPFCGPMIGDMVGCLLCCFNCCLGCCCWTFIAGIVWVLYRPSVGIPLLVVCMLAAAGMYFFSASKDQGKDADDDDSDSGDRKDGCRSISVDMGHTGEAGSFHALKGGSLTKEELERKVEESGHPECDECDHDVASHHCDDCHVWLCQECSDHHARMKRTRDHVLVSFEEWGHDAVSDTARRCDVCDGDDAQVRCHECSEWLCEACERHHRRSRRTKDHSLKRHQTHG